MEVMENEVGTGSQDGAWGGAGGPEIPESQVKGMVKAKDLQVEGTPLAEAQRWGQRLSSPQLSSKKTASTRALGL